MNSNRLSETLRKTVPRISQGEISRFAAYGREKAFRKGEIAFSAGVPFLKLLFVEQGMLRAYRIVKGKDVTFFFFFESDFAVDYESYLTEQPSPLYLETCTDCRLIEFEKNAVLSLYPTSISFQALGRIMAERAYLSATQRLKQFQTDSLEERYLALLEKNPELFQRIPQYHLASYLGVNPQSLSRLRAKFSNKFY